MNLTELRAMALEWLAPGLSMEVCRLRWMSEAMHDLHMTQLPYGEMELEMAFQNCKAMEPELMAGDVTIQDRQASLMEIYNRRMN